MHTRHCASTSVGCLSTSRSILAHPYVLCFSVPSDPPSVGASHVESVDAYMRGQKQAMEGEEYPPLCIPQQSVKFRPEYVRLNLRSNIRWDIQSKIRSNICCGYLLVSQPNVPSKHSCSTACLSLRSTKSVCYCTASHLQHLSPFGDEPTLPIRLPKIRDQSLVSSLFLNHDTSLPIVGPFCPFLTVYVCRISTSDPPTSIVRTDGHRKHHKPRQALTAAGGNFIAAPAVNADKCERQPREVFRPARLQHVAWVGRSAASACQSKHARIRCVGHPLDGVDHLRFCCQLL